MPCIKGLCSRDGHRDDDGSDAAIEAATRAASLVECDAFGTNAGEGSRSIAERGGMDAATPALKSRGAFCNEKERRVAPKFRFARPLALLLLLMGATCVHSSYGHEGSRLIEDHRDGNDEAGGRKKEANSGDEWKRDNSDDGGTSTFHTQSGVNTAVSLTNKVKNLSRNLRGADASKVMTQVHDIVASAQDFLKAQLDGVQNIQQMSENGDKEGLASGIKSFIADSLASIEAARELKEVADVPLPAEMDLAVENVPDLAEIPGSQLSEMIKLVKVDELVRGMEDRIEDLGDIKSLLQSAQKPLHRRLEEENLFTHQRQAPWDHFEFDSDPFGFDPGHNGREKQFNPRSAFARKPDMRKMLRKARAEAHRRGPGSRKYFHFGGDAGGSNRRLKANERRQRRLEGLSVCSPSCSATDTTCNCNRLSSCVKNMSAYDITLLFVDGYVETDLGSDDYADFTVTDTTDLNLFDADQNIFSKVEQIQALAKDPSKCSGLLAQLHSPCSPWKESCSEPNTQSYQLSIDDVCEAVDTPTKLYLASISSELDGYASNTGIVTYTTTCGENRVAFESCKDFSVYFEKLYAGRDLAKYPNENPMRPNPSKPVNGNKGVVNFPYHYRIERDPHGVAGLAFNKASECPTEECIDRCAIKYGGDSWSGCSEGCATSLCDVDEIVRFEACEDISCTDPDRCDFACEFWNTKTRQATADTDKCMNIDSSNNVGMATCDDQSVSQEFLFDASSHQISYGDGDSGKCIDHSLDVLRLSDCDGGDIDQKWFYDYSTKQLKSYQGNCLEASSDGVLSMKSTCTNDNNQQFLMPFRWLTLMSSTSIYEEVRSDYAGGRCMDARQDDGTADNVYMHLCEDKNHNQKWYYEASTHRIKNRDKCLDQNTETNNVYMHECHDGLNQKWYFDSATKALKSYYDDRCLDLYVDEADQWNLYMGTCSEGDNQNFLIPTFWLPHIYLNDIRVFSDRTKCMDADPDYNNNVRMAECEAGSINQHFSYDANLEHITNHGLCLDYNIYNDNAYLYECHDGKNQKWYYDKETHHLKTRHDGKCLDMCLDTICGLYNLYMHDCLSADNQRFTIPTWWPDETSLQETETYLYRPIPTGIWNGDWNEKTDCTVDGLTDVINTCDESMSLLLGHVASLGTLRDTANLVNDKGPGRMPGECCLDDPLDSQYFGYYYEPTREDTKGMACQNRGPWHLGISKEACENANGRWTRSPCITLQECIASRPTKKSAGYSQSFEDFARDLAIEDAANKEECGNARQGLGFEADYPFDTDVCEEFNNLMCDPYYDDLDAVTEDTEPTWENISYDPPDYPPDDKLSKKELPDLESSEKADDSTLKTAVNVLQGVQTYAWANFQATLSIARQTKEKTKWTCDSIGNSFFQGVCYATTTIILLLSWFNEYVSLALWIASDYTYVLKSQQLTNYAKLNYNLLYIDRDWNFNALQVINDNMYNQHTQVREDLQQRHTLMEDHLTKYMMCSTNYLGIEIILAIDPDAAVDPLSPDCCDVLKVNCNALQVENERDGPFRLIVRWPDNMKGLFTEMGEIKKHLIGLGIGESEKRSKARKSKKEKMVAGSVNGTNTRNLLDIGEGDNDRIKTRFNAVEDKLNTIERTLSADGGMEMEVQVIKREVEVLSDDMKTIKGKVGAIEGKVADLSDDIKQVKELLIQMMQAKQS